MLKPSFPPLFPAGFHDLTDEELRQRCVTNFENSERRDMLYCNLIQLVTRFRDLNQAYSIISEIWIDGSFTTEKVEPDDIDILIVLDYTALNAIPEQLHQTVGLLLNREYIKQNYNIDVLPLAQNHPAVDYEERRSYWRGWFGFDRQENPKGLVRIAL